MMVDWFGSSKRVRSLGEQVAALRAEIGTFREERARALEVEAQQQAATVALNQELHELRDRVASTASDISSLREMVEEDERRRPTIEEKHKRLEMAMLKLERRLQLQDEQAAKATTALFELIELRRRPGIPHPDDVGQ